MADRGPTYIEGQSASLDAFLAQHPPSRSDPPYFWLYVCRWDKQRASSNDDWDIMVASARSIVTEVAADVAAIEVCSCALMADPQSVMALVQTKSDLPALSRKRGGRSRKSTCDELRAKGVADLQALARSYEYTSGKWMITL